MLLAMTDPVGTGEIAERLNVKHQTVRQWKARGLLPVPTWKLGSRPVWEWSAIEAWAKETGRLAH